MINDSLFCFSCFTHNCTFSSHCVLCCVGRRPPDSEEEDPFDEVMASFNSSAGNANALLRLRKGLDKRTRLGKSLVREMKGLRGGLKRLRRALVALHVKCILRRGLGLAGEVDIEPRPAGVQSGSQPNLLAAPRQPIEEHGDDAETPAEQVMDVFSAALQRMGTEGERSQQANATSQVVEPGVYVHPPLPHIDLRDCLDDPDVALTTIIDPQDWAPRHPLSSSSLSLSIPLPYSRPITVRYPATHLFYRRLMRQNLGLK